MVENRLFLVGCGGGGRGRSPLTPCAGQRSDQVIPGQIYDQVHLVMTRYTWSDDQVPGHIYPGKYPGAQVTRYPGTQVPRYPGTQVQVQEQVPRNKKKVVKEQPQLHMTNTKVSSHVGHLCTEEIMIQQFTRKIT